MDKLRQAEIEQFVDKIETALDSFIDTGTEDELFISGYLHGHFSLATSLALQQPNPDVELIQSKLMHSLQKAFDNSELDQDYQQRVYSMWNQLADIAS